MISGTIQLLMIQNNICCTVKLSTDFRLQQLICIWLTETGYDGNWKDIEVTSWLVGADDFSSRVARGANERVSAANE